jgi:LPXTG-motif cell wall-anchored protein
MSFANCTEAYAHGYANIQKGSAQYAVKLDSDRDGVACENPPAGFKAAPAPARTKESSTGTKAQSVGNPHLPQTGPGEVTAVGAVLVLLGVVATMAFRRRRTRFAV